ncbi:WG containing repeat protein [compost metagenome]
MVVPFIYDIADDFKGGVAIVRNNNKCGIIDKKGKEVTPLIYDGMDNFNNDTSGFARVQRNKKWGFINKSGKEIVPCIYDKANFFRKDIAFVVKDGKCGYVNTSGKEIAPLTKEDCSKAY